MTGCPGKTTSSRGFEAGVQVRVEQGLGTVTLLLPGSPLHCSPSVHHCMALGDFMLSSQSPRMLIHVGFSKVTYF